MTPNRTGLRGPARGARQMAPRPPAPTYAKGRWAELAAAALLLLKGYRILARRFRSPVGEIDLVARRGRRLAFVEVKSRATHDAAAWSVTPRQQQRIARAAEAWLKRHPRHAACEIGFDVVLVSPRARPRHLRDAFSL